MKVCVLAEMTDGVVGKVLEMSLVEDDHQFGPSDDGRRMHISGEVESVNVGHGFSRVSATIPALQPDPYPERRRPEYCWKNWPPVHSEDCGCERKAP